MMQVLLMEAHVGSNFVLGFISVRPRCALVFVVFHKCWFLQFVKANEKLLRRR